VTSADFATDAAAAVGCLRTRADIDRAAIGLIGGEPGADDQCNPHAVVPVLAGQLNEQSSEFKKMPMSTETPASVMKVVASPRRAGRAKVDV
jgi:hypothetical protein